MLRWTSCLPLDSPPANNHRVNVRFDLTLRLKASTIEHMCYEPEHLFCSTGPTLERENMLDKLLEIGSSFDWISPIAAYVGDIACGPGHTLMIPVDCGWSGFAIERYLHRYGIRTWGGMIVNRTIMLTVPLSQAEFAEYLLLREGLLLENRRPPHSHRHSTSPCQESQSIIKHLDDVLDLLGELIRGIAD